MEVLLYTILTLCALGVLSAVILYFVAQKFRVEEDPRIDEVEKMLPGANCGGCGFAGCRGLADALVKRDDISALFCPVGGGETMKSVAAYLGKAAAEKQPEAATVRCGGEFELRNPAGGLVLCDKTSDGKSGNLHYYNTGATELVFRASSMGATCDVFQPGGSTVFGTLGDPSWITAKHEQDYQLTLTNCSTMFTRDSGTFYKDENINLRQTRPLDGTVFKGWTVTTADGTDVPFESTSNGIRFTMPACAVMAAANWERATGQALWLSTERGHIMVTADLLKADPINGITYEAVSYTHLTLPTT